MSLSTVIGRRRRLKYAINNAAQPSFVSSGASSRGQYDDRAYTGPMTKPGFLSAPFDVSELPGKFLMTDKQVMGTSSTAGTTKFSTYDPRGPVDYSKQSTSIPVSVATNGQSMPYAMSRQDSPWSQRLN